MTSDPAPQTAQGLVLTFWAIVDEILDQPGEALFLPDGALRIEAFEAQGQAQLAGYFRGRRAKSADQSRLTRHVVSNLRQTAMADDRVTIDCLVTVFSGYGARPVALGAPSSIADFMFDCHRDGAGRWHLSAVTGRLIFAGPDTPDLSAAQRSVEG